jgi:hypothetical protein
MEREPQQGQEQEQRSATSPPEDTSEATTPPGSGEVDEEAVEKAREKLDQAGGGH